MEDLQERVWKLLSLNKSLGYFLSFSEIFYKLYFNLIFIRCRIPNVSIGDTEPSSDTIISTLYYNREVDSNITLTVIINVDKLYNIFADF